MLKLTPTYTAHFNVSFFRIYIKKVSGCPPQPRNKRPVKNFIKWLVHIERDTHASKLLVCSYPIVTIARNQQKEELRLFGVRIYRRPLPARYELKRLINLTLMGANHRELVKIDQNSTTRILYVMDSLEIVGGVETRLLSQFKYLSELGITPILLTEKNFFSPTFEYANFHLDFSGPNSEELLIELIRLSKATIVEFQLKSPRFLLNLNIPHLRAITRVGVCIHGNEEINHEKLRLLNYRMSSHIKIPNASIVTNWINPPSFSCSPNITSKKALFISRIDSEKLPTLRNFVDLCKHYGFSFDIAGSLDTYNKKLMDEIAQLALPDESMIGPIRTLDFLRDRGSEYTFVAGVGQVPLEVASHGLPAVVVPHRGDFTLSTVLTKDNFAFLREWNMVIRLCPDFEFLGNIDAFMKDCVSNNINKYLIKDLVIQECDIENALSKYLSIVIQNTQTR